MYLPSHSGSWTLDKAKYIKKGQITTVGLQEDFSTVLSFHKEITISLLGSYTVKKL
jgi:hypothetical protein